MADEQPIGADDIARKQFGTAFRGFDQYEVRAFLAQVAAEVAALQERQRSLEEKLASAESRPAPRDVGADELEAALGAETTRVLHAAREAAAEIRAKAEESVARMLREANDESSRLRSEAETILARRTEEAESAASAILRTAEEAATTLRADADAAATATVEDAMARGKEMLAEAQAVRERVLKDLQRRRKAAAQQLEQLLAGRQRLLEAYEVVRDNVDLAFRELEVVEDEARLAAEIAGHKAPAEVDIEPSEPSIEVEVAVVAVPEPAPAPEVAVVPEPQPEPEPEPEPEPQPDPEERRSSSLRLLRRRPEDEPPALEGEVEGVRLLRPDAAPKAAPVVRPTLVPDPEPAVAAAPEPEPEPAPVPAPEPEPEVAVVEPEPEPEPEPEHEHEEHAVDDLFARLRADRAKAVAQAEAVLAESPVAVLEPEVEPEPEPEVEPVVEVAAGDAVFEARDAAVEPVERSLTRALKRALADEQNEVLDGLRRLRGTPSIDAVLPDAAAHAARYADLTAEHLAVGAAAGAASLGGEAPAIGDLASSIAGEVVDELRARLVRAFDASAGDDEALVETISATYREWKTARSEPLARHGLAAAYAAGAFAAAPTDEPLRWVVDEAEGGCPDCDDNALAGPTAKGQAFPTGQLHPPAHTGCRCLVLPAS